MKTTVKEKQEKEITFPCLMRSKCNRTVIMAKDKTYGGYVGFVVHRGHVKDYPLGHFSTFWSHNDFVPFDGSVTLSNN